MSAGLKRYYSDSMEETHTRSPRISLFSSLARPKRQKSMASMGVSPMVIPQNQNTLLQSHPIPLASRITDALSGDLQANSLLNPARQVNPKDSGGDLSLPRTNSTFNASFSRLTQTSIGDSSFQSLGFAIIGNRSVGVNAHKPKQPSPDVLLLKMALLENYRKQIAKREKELVETFDKDSERELAERRARLEREESQRPAESRSSGDDDDVETPLTEEQKLILEKHFRAASTHPYDTIVDAFKIELTYKDLATLRPKSWLNDNVIDLYLNVVALKAPNVAVFTTHFFSRLSEDGYSAVRRWAIRKKLDVFAPDFVFVPINQGNMHWTLAVVNNKNKRLEFYDSLPSGKGARELNVLLSYLRGEATRMGKSDIPEYTMVPTADCPAQSNGYDCGVFVCEVVSRLARGKRLTHSQRDMPLVRNRIAHSLLELKNSGSKL